MMRRVLIVSPHFPPLNAPDMQRVRMSLPYYRAAGWEPVVLAVGDAWQEGVREPELARTVPSDITVIRTAALSRRWTRLLGVRNLGLRCWLHFLFAGSRAIRRERIDLVFFSNTQWLTFTLGRVWRAWHGVPYVFDMQDPWRTDHYARAGSRRPPGGWKYQVARGLAWLLEGWSFARVSAVMSVSPNYLSDLRARYPRLASVPSAVIRFGGSREDLAQALSLPAAEIRFPRARGEIHLLYTGAVVAGMPPALHVLFAGLRAFREQNPVAAGRLRFHFLGTSYVAPGQGRDVVRPIAEQYGVADQVAEISHRLGHLECLRLQHDADALLLPGSSDLAYSPSKTYPYFLAERPILAIVDQGSVLEDILRHLNCATVAVLRPGDANDAALARIAGFLAAALAGFPSGTQPARNRAGFEAEFMAETLTRDQGALFAAALAPHPTSR